MSNEPVAVSAGIIALAQAILVCITVFGVTLSADQTAAIMGVVTTLVAVVAGVVTRKKVTPS